MRRVIAPPHGSSWRLSSKGYVEGVFLVDGQRVFRSLCKFEHIRKSPKRKIRTPRQIDGAIQTLWEQKRDELLAALPPDTGETTSMAELFREWIKHARNLGRDADTIRSRELLRDYYALTVGDHPVEEYIPSAKRNVFDIAHADKFRVGLKALRVKRGKTPQPLSKARINTYLGLLGSALHFAVERYWLGHAPKIEKVRDKARRIRVPTAKHIHGIRARLVELSRTANHPRDKAYYRLHRLLFYVLLFTGMRGGEVISIRREHVFLDRQWILLEETKTDEPRLVRFGPFLRGKIRAHLNAHPGTVFLFADPYDKELPAWRGVGEASQAMRRHMEITGNVGAFKALHGYRAGFATVGLNTLSLPSEAIRPQLGHKELSTTLDYYVGRMDTAQAGAVDAMESELRSLLGGNLEEQTEKTNIIN